MAAALRAGRRWNTAPSNHDSLLCSIESRFGLPKLGYAGQAGLNCFGNDVYTRWLSTGAPGLTGAAPRRRA